MTDVAPMFDLDDDYVNGVTKDWKHQAFVHGMLQNMSHRHYRTIYNFLTYPIMLFSAASAALTFGSSQPGTRYTSAGLSLSVVVFISLVRQIRPAEMAEIHISAVRRCEAILRKLHSFSMLPRHLRARDQASFLYHTRATIDDVTGSIVPPPRWVLRNFTKEFGPADSILYGNDALNTFDHKEWPRSKSHVGDGNGGSSIVIDIARDLSVATSPSQWTRPKRFFGRN
jgi:hypothetical protein